MRTRHIEPIYAALFAMLDALRVAGVVKVADRRLKHVNEYPLENMPAVFQNQGDIHVSGARTGLPKNALAADWYVYVPGTSEGVNVTELNNVVDAVIAALAPPYVGAKQTLGGLVEDCYVEGTIEVYEGVLQDRAVAVIPIVIVAPGF